VEKENSRQSHILRVRSSMSLLDTWEKRSNEFVSLISRLIGPTAEPSKVIGIAIFGFLDLWNLIADFREIETELPHVQN